MKFRQLVKELESLGFVWTRGNGGHQIFTSPIASRAIVVPMDNKEIWSGLAKKYLKQAKLALAEYQAATPKQS